MSYAQIESALGKGRYRVKLDFGEAQRQALIAANEDSLAQITYKMEVARTAVLAAEIKEAESRQAISQIIDQIVLISTPELQEPLRALLNDTKQRYVRLVASNQPTRTQYALIKKSHADGVKRRIKWASLQCIEYRDAWCADYTLNAQGYVATLDIPGDDSLVLLAPGCRPWRQGDGTISNERKTQNIAALQIQLTPLNEEKTKITGTLIPQLEAKIKLTVIQRNLVLEAVTLNPSPENRKSLEEVSKRLDAERAELAKLKAREAVLQKQIETLDLQVTYWMSRRSSNSPDYGDGRYIMRDLCSPEQAFFNGGIFPGWQKFKPTYRTGRITYINYDANLANVSLAPATSTASGPRLDVNQTPQLNGIPVIYMSCAARAFEVGDDVVVRFASQRWEEPSVIGFVDTPKRCPPIFIGNQLFTAGAVQLQVGVPMDRQQVLYGELTGDELIADYLFIFDSENSIEGAWIGGVKPYSYSFVDAETREVVNPPSGITINQGSGVFEGTPNESFETMTVRIRCYDSEHVEGKNRRYSDSTPFEFSSGRLVPVSSSFAGGAVSYMHDGTFTWDKDYTDGAFEFIGLGKWFDAGDSKWAADRSVDWALWSPKAMPSPRYNNYALRIVSKSGQVGFLPLIETGVWEGFYTGQFLGNPPAGLEYGIYDGTNVHISAPLLAEDSGTITFEFGYFKYYNGPDDFEVVSLGFAQTWAMTGSL